jgi:hypothetical protein
MIVPNMLSSALSEERVPGAFYSPPERSHCGGEESVAKAVPMCSGLSESRHDKCDDIFFSSEDRDSEKRYTESSRSLIFTLEPDHQGCERVAALWGRSIHSRRAGYYLDALQDQAH